MDPVSSSGPPETKAVQSFDRADWLTLHTKYCNGSRVGNVASRCLSHFLVFEGASELTKFV